jgi:hypothetical protein
MIEYFRLNIEYLWNAVDLKKTEHSESFFYVIRGDPKRTMSVDARSREGQVTC